MHSTNTEFTLSPYWVVNFDSLGVGTVNNSVVIVNDTTLTAVLFIDGQASLGWHRCIVADQYNNIFDKDSSFWVFLSIPTVPQPLLPLNNSSNIPANPVFYWDSNWYALTYHFQIASDSTFPTGTIIFDTTLSNASLPLRTGILNYDTRYFWRLNATNSLGTSDWSVIFKFRVRTIGIQNISTVIPEKFALMPNFPNPFNPVTKIRFMLPKSGNVKLKIFDMSGKELESPVNQYLQPGTYEYSWNASQYASGIYFYVLESNDYREVRKAVLIK
ncbi:MAG: T9SS type A sorting domain-containing protein [Bacteroidetes bacterium]|nr:T9SS type A sorting domain-containing protein [Bacteroidota bacterium]